MIQNTRSCDSLACGREGTLACFLEIGSGKASPHVLTLIVSAVQVGSVASVHPPSRGVLEGTVAVVLVVVIVSRAELHAVVNGVGLVTRVIPEVKAIEGISCIAAKVVGVGQTVLVRLCSNTEHGIVGIPDGGGES